MIEVDFENDFPILRSEFIDYLTLGIKQHLALFMLFTGNSNELVSVDYINEKVNLVNTTEDLSKMLSEYKNETDMYSAKEYYHIMVNLIEAMVRKRKMGAI